MSTLQPNETNPPKAETPVDTFLRRVLSYLPDEVLAAYEKDPALRGLASLEVLLYQGIWAIWAYRVAHALWLRNVPILPRLISQITRFFTLIEIHPGAKIGKGCFIDHGAGVVIGETSELGDGVMLYHGVTLGGHGWWADEKGSKRHPTIGNNVTLAVGCSILGPVMIGENSRIGPSAVVYQDVPPDSVVVAAAGRTVIERGKKKKRDDDDHMSSQWLQEYE